MCKVKICADCGTEIGNEENYPKDGWQLEDGRAVCHACCAIDTKKLINIAIATGDPGPLKIKDRIKRFIMP